MRNEKYQIKIAELDKPDHAEAVVSLLNTYAREPIGGGQALSDFCRHNLIITLQQREDIVVLLVFYQQQAIAFATCLEGFSTFQCKPLLNIHDIFVTEAHRGQGIASGLFEKITQIATDKGCCKLTLEVLQGNNIAQAVYRKVGFKAYQLNEQFGSAMFWQKPL